jgi:hypothetical protein
MKVRCLKFKVREGALKGILPILAVLIFVAQVAAAEKTDFQFKKQPEIQQVRPQKPVKVKLHWNAKGEYSWELSGDNVDEIVNQDRKLRKLLKVR